MTRALLAALVLLAVNCGAPTGSGGGSGASSCYFGGE